MQDLDGVGVNGCDQRCSNTCHSRRKSDPDREEMTGGNVTFSVIVPVYNIRPYLRQCVDSILGQACCGLEVLLVDDGSTDGSGRICDEYAARDARVRVLHKSSEGVSEARNAGVCAARGAYILFVDGDDFIAAHALRRIETIILRRDCPDIVCLECVKLFADGRCVSMNDGVTKELNRKTGGAFLNYIAQLPKYPASAWSKAIRRQFFLDHKLFFKRGIYFEDLEWAARLFLAVDTATYAPVPYYFYRQNRDGSLSGVRSEKKAFDLLHIVEAWCRCAGRTDDRAKRRMIYSLMEYVFRFLLLQYSDVSHGKRKRYAQGIRACEVVLGTRKDKVSRMIYGVYRRLGIFWTGFLLKVYLRMRRG